MSLSTHKATFDLAPRVLLAEDDEDCRDALAMTLASEGYALSACATGTALLSRLRATYGGRAPPAVVITDESMPGVRGLDVCERARSWGCKIPFVLITGMPDDDLARRALRLGVALLHKPFDPDDLRRIVECAALMGEAAPLACASCQSTEDIGAAGPECDVFFCSQCSELIGSEDSTDPYIDLGTDD